MDRLFPSGEVGRRPLRHPALYLQRESWLRIRPVSPISFSSPQAKAKVPKAAAPSNSSPAGEETEVARLTRELGEALEQLQRRTCSALSQALPAILSLFATMLEKAVRICDAKFGNIFRWDGETQRLGATHNTPPAYAKIRRGSPIRPDPNFPVGRMIATKTVVHVADLASEHAYTEHSPPSWNNLFRWKKTRKR